MKPAARRQGNKTLETEPKDSTERAINERDRALASLTALIEAVTEYGESSIGTSSADRARWAMFDARNQARAALAAEDTEAA